ncbi:Holliday junction recognition protein isoform 2-T2 [Sylvia borin]
MERNEAVQRGLRRSNDRFVASMNRILQQYNRPFEDDLLVSMSTLTYQTPDGLKQWENVSMKDVKKWKEEILKHNRQIQRTRVSEDWVSDSEDEHSPVHQVLEGDDGQIRKKERVPVDVIVQDDERNIPKWITITTPRSSKDHHLTSPVHKSFEVSEDWVSDSEDEHSPVHQVLEGDDGQILKKERVPVDVIVQDDERNIPKWITITTPRSSKDHHLTSPVHKSFGNRAAVCRKKLELSNECSSSKHLQLQLSGVLSSSNAVALPRQRPCPQLSTTPCGSILGECQPADEGCSWSNTTLADLYPAMLEIFTKLMAKHYQRKVLKYMFGHSRSKKWHSRRRKRSVTVDKMGRSGTCKLKKAFHSICSCTSEDSQNPTGGNESRELCGDNSLVSNSSSLVPYAYSNSNEIKIGYSDSDLKQHLASRKGQEVCKPTTFPDVMDRMGETFLVEEELQTTASPKNLEYTESKKWAYKRFSKPSSVTSTASSDSRAVHLVKERKTQKTDFYVGTSELGSWACSSHGNSNNSIPITDCSPARSSNTVLINPEKIIPERQTSFQHKDSFSSCFMKQSPSKMPDKYEDAFEELYYKVCSGEFQKCLTLTRPLLNSQNLEEKGRLVKSSLGDFGGSIKQIDREFNRLYEKLSVPGNRWESLPEFPVFQTASNFRKYPEIQMPETVNALVNSPVRSYSSVFRVKREGNSENYLPCSPLKRLKLTPECWTSSRKCQKIAHSKKGNPQTAGMDFLSTCNCSNPSLFADHSCRCQGSRSHDSSDRSFLGIPGTSLQESGTAGVHSGWPGAMGNCSSLRNVRSHLPRVYRKLSYTDGQDQL